MRADNKQELPENDVKGSLERALKSQQAQKYIFRLYVSGATAKSTRAVENIRNLSEKYLKGRYELEVIDIFQHPEIARRDQIIAAPTLIKKLPLPLRRFIGDLSETERIIVNLEIKEPPHDEGGEGGD
jgi:circadian clock protein KaiB